MLEPSLQHSDGRRQEDGPQYDAEHAEAHDAAQDAKENQSQRQCRTAADQNGFDEVIHRTHRKRSPQNQEHRPADLIGRGEPDGNRTPHQRRTNGHDGEHTNGETEHHNTRNISNDKADGRHHPLPHSGAEHAEDHRAGRVDQNAGVFISKIARDSL